jgi:hypothetical protein
VPPRPLGPIRVRSQIRQHWDSLLPRAVAGLAGWSHSSAATSQPAFLAIVSVDNSMAGLPAVARDPSGLSRLQTA